MSNESDEAHIHTAFAREHKLTMKNIIIKMLEDVGMIVPKSDAVYMPQDRR